MGGQGCIINSHLIDTRKIINVKYIGSNLQLTTGISLSVIFNLKKYIINID